MPPYDLIDPTIPDINNRTEPFRIQNLCIDPTTDKFLIKGAAGVAVAHVQKPDGRVYSMRVQANGALQQFTQFDANRLTVEERRKLEAEMYHNNQLTQSEIADILGVSQATISNDLKIIKQQNS